MELDTLAKRFTKARKDMGLTQEQLAKKADTTQAVINKIEKGKSLMPRHIDRLAKEMDTSPAWLQFGVESLDHLSKENIEVVLELSKLPDDEQKIVKSTIKAFRDARLNISK